jgi:hypothetical protein
MVAIFMQLGQFFILLSTEDTDMAVSIGMVMVMRMMRMVGIIFA